MNIDKFLKEFNNLLLDDEVDDNFKSIICSLIYSVNRNPNQSIDMGYLLREAFLTYQSNRIKSSDTNKEKNIFFKEIDWSCFFYGKDCFSSYFGSYMPTEIKNYGFFKIFGENFNQIYKSKDGKIHLKYQPKFLTQKSNEILRNANLFHYIELVLLPIDVNRLKITEDDTLVLTTKNDLGEEIQKKNVINCESKFSDMDRVLVPLEKEQVINEEDIAFVKILIDFIQQEKSIASCSILNILDGEKALNVSDVIYMYNVFAKAGFDNIAYNSYKMEVYDCEYVSPTPITVKTEKCKRVPLREDSWIEQIDNVDYLNAIMINSSNLFLSHKSALNLDITQSFATPKNIDEFIQFIEQRGIYRYTSELNALKQKIKVKKI